MIIIRKFKPSDFPWVIDIERKVFDEHDPYLYMQFYETYPESFIVAEINGFVVGYVTGFMAKEGVGRVFSLAVHPSYQNRGVGGNLLNEIIEIFQTFGVIEVTLEVRAGNIKARKLYQKYGFRQVGIKEKYYNDAENACLMKLEIK